MGSSREIAIGPVAVVSLLLSSLLSQVEDPVANPDSYRNLAFTVTFFAGIFQASFGIFRCFIYVHVKLFSRSVIFYLFFIFLIYLEHWLISNIFRLGFLIDFLSHAALVGFMAGAAIMIGLQQLKGLLGITHFTNKTDAVSVLGSVYKSLHHQLTSGSADKVSFTTRKFWIFCLYVSWYSIFVPDTNMTLFLFHYIYFINSGTLWILWWDVRSLFSFSLAGSL